MIERGVCTLCGKPADDIESHQLELPRLRQLLDIYEPSCQGDAQQVARIMLAEIDRLSKEVAELRDQLPTRVAFSIEGDVVYLHTRPEKT